MHLQTPTAPGQRPLMQAELLAPQGPLQLGASRSLRLGVGPAATMVAMARAKIAEKFMFMEDEVVGVMRWVM